MNNRIAFSRRLLLAGVFPSYAIGQGAGSREKIETEIVTFGNRALQALQWDTCDFSLQERYRRAAIVLALLLVVTAMGSLRAQNANPPRPGGLQNHGTYITPADIPLRLATFLEQTGMRMTSAEKAQVTLTGSMKDATGTRPAQVTIQAPGYLSYREGNERALTFDGTGFKTKKGSLGTDDEAVAESLLAHYPDALLLQAAAGGSFRRLGSNFRPAGSTSSTYTGSYWTVIAFSPQKRPGLALGKALQQELLIALDNRTNLVAEVRSVVSTGGQQQRVIQTQLMNWVQYGDQWFPGLVIRLEGGREVFRFQLQQAIVGVADSAATFVP